MPAMVVNANPGTRVNAAPVGFSPASRLQDQQAPELGVEFQPHPQSTYETKLMSDIYWFSVPNLEKKRYPEWRRSFGVNDERRVFVPAAMAADTAAQLVVVLAITENQPVAEYLNHPFVPSDWLKRDFPKHRDLIEIIEARAQAEDVVLPRVPQIT